MTWYYKGEPLEEIPEGYSGFVYCITRLDNNKKYIGKKLFHFRKTRQVNKKKKRYLAESDWQEYYGSNDELIKEVEEQGPDQFRREIIRLCASKGEMSYIETKYIFENDAILSDEYYNSWVSAKIRKSHVKNLIEEKNAI